jgi:hypothetical protein
MAHYCLTSTIMLSLTTNDESSGTFSLSGSIRRQVHVFSFSLSHSLKRRMIILATVWEEFLFH